MSWDSMISSFGQFNEEAWDMFEVELFKSFKYSEEDGSRFKLVAIVHFGTIKIASLSLFKMI